MYNMKEIEREREKEGGREGVGVKEIESKKTAECEKPNVAILVGIGISEYRSQFWSLEYHFYIFIKLRINWVLDIKFLQNNVLKYFEDINFSRFSIYHFN